MESVKDKVVLITGASSGIGAGTAKLFAKYGAKLVIGGRNEENLRKTAKCCEEEGVKANDILIVPGDLMKEDDCNGIVDKAVEKFGQLDVVVNNAGTTVMGNIDVCTVKDLDFMYNVLVRSVFVICKRAVPHLKQSKGCIVNVSTAGSKMAPVGLTAYAMMKAAVNHFSNTLAQDLGPSGVRVNCVLPGGVDTGIFDTGATQSSTVVDTEEMYARMIDAHALRRMGEANEVAQLIVFLGSNAASFMTGGQVLVDGGISSRSTL